MAFDENNTFKTFHDCSSSLSKCQRSDWVFGGVAGICNNITQLCECPDGFSGNDDFDFYNDCHVNHRVRLAFRILGMIASIVCLMVNIVLFIKLLLQWGLLYIPDPEPESDSKKNGSTYGGRKTTINNNNNNYNDERTYDGSKVDIVDERRASKSPGDDINVSVIKSSALIGTSRTSLALTASTMPSMVENVDVIIPEEGAVEQGLSDNNSSFRLQGSPSNIIKHEGDEDRLISSPPPMSITTPIKEENENELTSTSEHGIQTTRSKSQQQQQHNTSNSIHYGSMQGEGEHKSGNKDDELVVTLDNNERESSFGNRKRSQYESGNGNNNSNNEKGIFGSFEGRASFIEGTQSLVATTVEIKNKVTKEMKRVPRPSMAAIKELSPVGNNAGVSPNSSASAAIVERRRKRITISFVFMFLLFSICVVIYEGLLFLGLTHAQNNGVVNFCLASIIACICWGLWLLAFMWFGNLPSLASFGKMFNLKSILIKYPNMVKYLTITHMVVSAIICYGFLFILPLAIPHLRYAFDTVALTFIAIFVCDFCIVFLSICRVLLQQFKLLESRFAPRASLASSTNNSLGTKTQDSPKKSLVPIDNQKKKNDAAVLKAKGTVKIAMVSCIIAAPPVVILACVIAFSPVGRANLWILTQFVILIGTAVSMLALHVVINRTAGGRAKKSGNNNNNNNNNVNVPRPSALSGSMGNKR